MLRLGEFRASTCGGWSRRAFLQTAGTLPTAWGLGEAAAAERAGARARSVILLWLWGAPSHLDTFDPKPDAPDEYRGPFAPIATRTPGLQFSELLPRLADRRQQIFSVNRQAEDHRTVIDSPGVNVRRLTQQARQDIRPRFSPDGRRLLLVCERGGEHDLYLVNVPGETASP